MAELITKEPRDLDALVLTTTGGGMFPVVFGRDDAADPEDPRRWLPLVGNAADPVCWEQVCHELILTGDGELLWMPRAVIRLWRTGEEIEEVGGHRVVVSTGRCTCHGQWFAPTELDRMRQVPA